MAAALSATLSCAVASQPDSARQGEIAVAQSAPVPLTALKNGKDVYDAVCAACHSAGLTGAPRTGDKQAWAGRLAEGMGLLYLHTLKGYTGKSGIMPARGGRPDLPTELVKQGVDYIVSQSN
jgi:cytochrome c5